MVNYNIVYNKAIYKYFLKIFYNKTYKKNTICKSNNIMYNL